MLLRFVPRVLACLLVVLLTGCASSEVGAATASWAEGMATVQESRLPAQARETLDLIDAGGPFPYEKDGSVFGNFERRLPSQIGRASCRERV